MRSFTEATTAQQVIDFLHEEIPGYPSAFPPAAAAADAVPRVLHVSWATQALPAFAQTYLETWRAHHPTWRVARWTDATMRDFVRRRFPGRLAAYDAFPNAVNRADVFRYMVLFEIGGVYVDLDVEALRSIEPLLYHVVSHLDDGAKNSGSDASLTSREEKDEEKRWRARASCLVGQEPHAHAVVLPRDAIAHKSRRACNAVMASAPGLAFWTTVLDEVERRSSARESRGGTRRRSRAIMLTSALEQTGFDARAGGCGVADPPETLFPAMDKSQFALAGRHARRRASSSRTASARSASAGRARCGWRTTASPRYTSRRARRGPRLAARLLRLSRGASQPPRETMVRRRVRRAPLGARGWTGRTPG